MDVSWAARRLLRAGVLTRDAADVTAPALAAGAKRLQQDGEDGMARARFACATGELRSRHGAAQDAMQGAHVR